MFNTFLNDKVLRIIRNTRTKQLSKKLFEHETSISLSVWTGPDHPEKEIKTVRSVKLSDRCMPDSTV